MQLVSDLQQRPNKGRLSVEKNIVPFFDVCSLVQMICLIIHIVQTTISARGTFAHYIIRNNPFELSPNLVYKTEGCNYTATRDIYAFKQVYMSFTPDNVNDVFVDHAIQMRAAMFVMPVTLLFAVLNRGFVESNFFVFKYRNFFIWKDIFSATELLLLGYVIQIGVAARQPAGLLQDYLAHCGCASRTYLPFVPVITLFVFAAVGYFCYAVSGAIYLINALPKYGVMTPAEIQEYKEWLRKRNAEIEQSKALIEQAKAAQAQLQMVRAAQSMHDPQNRVTGGLPQLPPGMHMVGPDGSPILPPHLYSANAAAPPQPQQAQAGLATGGAPTGPGSGGELTPVPAMDNLQMQLYLMQLQRQQKRLLSQAPQSFTPSRNAAMGRDAGPPSPVPAAPPPMAPLAAPTQQPAPAPPAYYQPPSAPPPPPPPPLQQQQQPGTDNMAYYSPPPYQQPLQ